MISIVKPVQPPAVLTKKGKEAIDAMKAEFDRSPDAYLRGEKGFTFRSDIYGHATVKEALVSAQFGKCFLCESKVAHVAFGDVEHFRPKAGYRQKESDDLGKPGYYWLAYEWSNLFFACQLCNQKFKRNLFPLGNPKRRAVSHNNDVALEKPQFIDPAVEDPAQFISFRKEMAFPVRNRRRAQATIKLLGLNRPELSEMRFDSYQRLKVLFAISRLGIPESAEAQAVLDASVRDDAQYAGMARAAVAAGFKETP